MFAMAIILNETALRSMHACILQYWANWAGGACAWVQVRYHRCWLPYLASFRQTKFEFGHSNSIHLLAQALAYVYTELCPNAKRRSKSAGAKVQMENGGIDPPTSRMLSERSTI